MVNTLKVNKMHCSLHLKIWCKISLYFTTYIGKSSTLRYQLSKRTYKSFKQPNTIVKYVQHTSMQ